MIVNLMISGCGFELYTVVGIGGFMLVNLKITGCGFELYCSWNWRFHDCQSYDYRLWV